MFLNSNNDDNTVTCRIFCLYAPEMKKKKSLYLTSFACFSQCVKKRDFFSVLGDYFGAWSTFPNDLTPALFLFVGIPDKASVLHQEAESEHFYSRGQNRGLNIVIVTVVYCSKRTSYFSDVVNRERLLP